MMGSIAEKRKCKCGYSHSQIQYAKKRRLTFEWPRPQSHISSKFYRFGFDGTQDNLLHRNYEPESRGVVNRFVLLASAISFQVIQALYVLQEYLSVCMLEPSEISKKSEKRLVKYGKKSWVDFKQHVSYQTYVG